MTKPPGSDNTKLSQPVIDQGLTNLPLGELFADRYKVLALVGHGGMGQVYLAEDQLIDGAQVALKLIHPQFGNVEGHRQRFLREVQISRKVGHPNVVRNFDVGISGERLYFTMEYVDGASLEQLLKSSGYFPFDLSVSLLLAIADGLTAIHREGVIHRDLKPGNVLVSKAGALKITDFGIARPDNSNLTQMSEMVGSSVYMAPELWTGQEPDFSVDLYALGIVAYELLTGRPTFSGSTHEHLMYQHLNEKPPVLQLPDGQKLPVWFTTLIAKLLAKSPRDRFAEVGVLADTVREMFSGDLPAISQIWTRDSSLKEDPEFEAQVKRLRRPSAEDARRELLPKAREALTRSWTPDSDKLEAVRLLAILNTAEALEILIEGFKFLTERLKEPKDSRPVCGELIAELVKEIFKHRLERGAEFLREVVRIESSKALEKAAAIHGLAGDADPRTFDCYLAAVSIDDEALREEVVFALAESLQRQGPQESANSRTVLLALLGLVRTSCGQEREESLFEWPQLAVFILCRYLPREMLVLAEELLIAREELLASQLGIKILRTVLGSDFCKNDVKAGEVEQLLLNALVDTYRDPAIYSELGELLAPRSNSKIKAAALEILAEEALLPRLARKSVEFVSWGLEKRRAHGLRRAARRAAAQLILGAS